MHTLETRLPHAPSQFDDLGSVRSYALTPQEAEQGTQRRRLMQATAEGAAPGALGRGGRASLFTRAASLPQPVDVRVAYESDPTATKALMAVG